MATKTNFAADNGQTIHRRVQQHIAGKYLEHIDPDGALVEELYKDKHQLFRETDPKIKKAFEEEHSKYVKTESIYSIQNVCWIIAAMGVMYYTDLYLVILYDPRINRNMFNIGVLLDSITVSIGAFFVLWLSCVKKVSSDDWERLYPAAIPIATGSFVLGGIFLVIGLWPVYGLLTPIILFILFMATVIVLAMLPNF